MRKLVFMAVLALGMSSVASAQTNEKAIGARFGLGGGAEISYQHPLEGNTRLEFDLGLNGFNSSSTTVSITGLYQKVFDFSALYSGFNWYLGAGPQLGFYSVRSTTVNGQKVDGSSGLALGVAGQIGLEYNLAELPLQFSLDWRPQFQILPGTAFAAQNVGLAVRYRF